MDAPAGRPIQKGFSLSPVAAEISQVWTMNADGSQARQITKVAAEASGISLLAQRRCVLFPSEVYPDCGADDACNARRIADDERANSRPRI